MGAHGGQGHGLHAFELVHPTVQLGCFAAVLAFTMAALQPVLLALSFVAAFSFSVYARGWRASLRILLWQVPLIALCALVNPLFSSMGTTELFRVGTNAVYGESVAFGACMGLMLASAMLWFSNAAQVLTADKVMAVWGNSLPTVGLMVSMTMRLVPQFVQRGRLIGSTAQAASSARPRTVAEKAAGRVRLVSVLMGWSMEDSLETADAMRARAWGATRRRTSYQRYRFGPFDTAASVCLGALVAADALLAWMACSQYHFYPTLSSLVLWWGYVPYAALLFLPLAACLIDDARWRRAA